MKDKGIVKDKLYSLQETAIFLRVSERSIFRYIHSGKLKASKIGYWRINGNDIKEFLLKNSNILQALENKSTRVPVKKNKRK